MPPRDNYGNGISYLYYRNPNTDEWMRFELGIANITSEMYSNGEPVKIDLSAYVFGEGMVEFNNQEPDYPFDLDWENCILNGVQDK